jgi:radical SAM superfamily enzyme YgiQ (UPF0313 family)
MEDKRLYFELPPYRPPSEAGSLLIRATRGCPWNRCHFCNLYKGSKFELRSVAEIKQDILAMKELADQMVAWAQHMGYGDRIAQVALYNGLPWLTDEGVKTAFLGDSNSLIMHTEDLAQVIEFLYHTCPTLERVTSYARAKTILHKKPEELKRLREAGLSRLHLGLESGDDEVLQDIQKGATAQDMIQAGLKVKEAGISLSEYIILGLAGKRRWREHALGTARVLNAIDPDFIRVRTLQLVPGSELRERVERGEFQPASIEEIVLETRLLIENLEVTSEFVSDHVSNYLNLNGKLPEAKTAMLAAIDSVLSAAPEVKARILVPKHLAHL